MNRAALVRRGLRLNYLTLAYNAFEAGVALAAGLSSGSVALVGFGIDSVIEVSAGAAAQWRLRADADAVHRARAERLTQRVVGLSFLALAVWVTYEAGEALWRREAPARSAFGVAVLALSVVVMPWLARAKRRVASALVSEALAAEATQTALCAYLSAIALAGVGLNVLFGWWWADPVAALGMVPIIAREGYEGARGRGTCTDCSAVLVRVGRDHAPLAAESSRASADHAPADSDYALMQRAEVIAGTANGIDATPAEMGRAAVRAARRVRDSNRRDEDHRRSLETFPDARKVHCGTNGVVPQTTFLDSGKGELEGPNRSFPRSRSCAHALGT